MGHHNTLLCVKTGTTEYGDFISGIFFSVMRVSVTGIEIWNLSLFTLTTPLVQYHTNNVLFLAPYSIHTMIYGAQWLTYLDLKICDTSRIMQPVAFSIYTGSIINHRLATFTNGLWFSWILPKPCAWELDCCSSRVSYSCNFYLTKSMENLGLLGRLYIFSILD